jgi:hypothetical protein
LAEMVLHEQLEEARAGGGDAGQAAERYRSWMREVSPD